VRIAALQWQLRLERGEGLDAALNGYCLWIVKRQTLECVNEEILIDQQI
jgi:hypothetical protein